MSARVVHGDARNLTESVNRDFDLVVTSPPYANRMSYIRELRPYMYWLGYLDDAKSAGDLDWEAIGGTWGSATSRVAGWEPQVESYEPTYLKDAIDQIERSSKKSGRILSRYVRRYFHDTWQHIQSMRETVTDGSTVVYIVGNSTFYGVLVPTERVYADMLKEAGFRDVEARIIRKRNSKKELYEYAVEATTGTHRPRRHRRSQLELFGSRQVARARTVS